MSKGKDRTVYQRDDKSWVNKRNDADKASSVHSTQKDAIVSAKAMSHRQGGGEVTVQGRDGQFRAKDTVAPGKDGFPPRG